ncbi:MAG: hypothetical protein ABSH25_12840 [Syntrophorhabdales bacterium]|jgi:hypothetical protein
MAAKAHAAHEVELDYRLPVGIARCFKGVLLVHAQVVNEDVDGREPPNSLLGPCRFREIGDERLQASVRMVLTDLPDGIGHLSLTDAVDDHPASLDSEGFGYGKAYARGGACD